MRCRIFFPQQIPRAPCPSVITLTQHTAPFPGPLHMRPAALLGRFAQQQSASLGHIPTSPKTLLQAFSPDLLLQPWSSCLWTHEEATTLCYWREGQQNRRLGGQLIALGPLQNAASWPWGMVPTLWGWSRGGDSFSHCQGKVASAWNHHSHLCLRDQRNDSN